MSKPLRKGDAKRINLELVRSRLKQVVLDYCEYSGMSYEEVVNLIKKGSELACNEWNSIVKTGSDEEILNFYTRSRYYIYEVLQPYLEPEKYNKDVNYLRILEFAKNLLENRGQCKVFEFGAGVGELCILLAKEGCDVTYNDLPGVISEFAKWRFQKHGVHISINFSRIDGVELPACEYDLIVSDAVVEHLSKKYLENFLRAFANALVDGGYMYLLWDPTYTDKYPYHILGMGARELDKILRRFSLVRISYNLYVKSANVSALLRHYLWLLKAMYVKTLATIRSNVKSIILEGRE